MAKEKEKPVPKISSNMNNDMQTGEGTAANPEKSYDDFDLWAANLSKKESATLASEETIKHVKEKISDELLKKRLAEIDEEYATVEAREAAKEELKKNWYKTEIEIAKKMEDNLYKYSDLKGKAQLVKSRRETAQKYSEEMKAEMAKLETEKMNGNHRNALMRKRREARQAADREVINNIRQEMKLTTAISTHWTADRKKKNDAINETRQVEYEAHLQNIENYDLEIAKLQEKEEQAKKNKPNDPNAGSTFKKEREELEQKRKDAQKDMNKSDLKNFGKALASNLETSLKDGVGKAIDKWVTSVNKSVDEAIETVGKYKSRIDARLQGTDSNYEEVAKVLKSSLSASPYVKQTAVLEKLNEAIDKGIAYNVEQRAFLQTVTDSIVATFNAFDSNLLRLIRLQQADMTAAKMGVEAQLLQFFNQTFSDNSYLEETYDTVSQSLIEANSQMSRDMSLSFEYTVQKWLGSLSALGFSTDTIQKIATGINYLGSGNVQALVSDTELMNLMAMSAYRAGYPISELLVKGIDDSSINDLLKSMVEYLAEIADNKNNAVVKAAYGDVFNFAQSDLRAIKNLNPEDIQNIYDQSISYSQAVGEAQDQLNKLPNRMSMTEKINNAWENFLYSSGESLARNAGTAITWKILTLIDDVTGGDIKLPELMVYGFGVNITSSIPNLIKAGMFGLSAMSQVGNLVTSVMNGGGLNLDIWDATEYTKRGGNFQPNTGGVQKSLSGSQTAKSSGASSDTKKGAIDSTSEDQEDSKKRSEELSKDEITLEVLYKEIFEKKSIMYVSDVPILSLMTPIAKSVASIDANVKSIASKIDNQGTSIKVHVTNLNEIAPKSTVSVDNLLGYTDADAFAKKFNNNIGIGVGVGTDADDEDVSVNTLVKKLLDGDITINVSDSITQGKLDTLDYSIRTS